MMNDGRIGIDQIYWREHDVNVTAATKPLIVVSGSNPDRDAALDCFAEADWPWPKLGVNGLAGLARGDSPRASSPDGSEAGRTASSTATQGWAPPGG